MPLDGVWYNELGSKMTLKTNGAQLMGLYETAVGAAKGEYPLAGLFTLDPEPTLGFVVAWQNSFGSLRSTTAWSGQYQNQSGVESLVTTWLLTSDTTPDQNWASTLVGQDVFTRQPPPRAQVEKALLRRAASHPLVAPRR
ncbi:MAG TPA: avidin/streptavidin family protein [Candidatus Thermoplasmatota archaeon]|nr:avidin/streptavidin family protein [Candidatus Thermoplasmatota archaeon]